MLIRRAANDDAQAIAELAGQLGYPTIKEEAASRLEATLQRDDHAVFVAQVPQVGVVAWIHVYGTYLLVAQPFAEVGGLVIDQSHRVMGIGRALIQAAETWAKEHGYSTVRIRSNTARQAAHVFYPRLGYERVKTQHTYAKTLTKLNRS